MRDRSPSSSSPSTDCSAGQPADEPSLDPYRRALQRHGPSFAATLWHSREGQELRFEVMRHLADFPGRRLADVGCGCGDFAAWLLDRHVDFAHYFGIDAMADMIEAARNRHLPRTDFVVGNALDNLDPVANNRPDWVCISGTLNTMHEPDAMRLVEGCFHIAARGVIFNFLSDRAHRCRMRTDLAPARRFDTVRWVEWALKLSTQVSFTQDYFDDGHDATICIRHPKVP